VVALGEGGVKTLEDLAGCASDDLTGWNETVNGERKHQTGLLETFGMTAEEANAIVMTARRAAGWIKDEEVAAEATEETAEA
jgi:N utilization substance protein A